MNRIKVFTIILSTLICINLFADPGDLDTNGGHYNQSTGKYHKHTASILEAKTVPKNDAYLARLQAQSDAKRNSENDYTWYATGGLLGVFGIGIAYLTTPSVPASKLIGKTPEYIVHYLEAYKEAKRDLQVIQATNGCLIGTGIAIL